MMFINLNSWMNRALSMYGQGMFFVRPAQVNHLLAHRSLI